MTNETHIKIEYDDHVEVTREADPNSEWDGDDISHDYSIGGYTVVGDKGYWDFILSNDPKGKPLYFLYALYDTGDSFHCEANKMCMIGLYEHEEDASAVMSALEKNYRDDKTRESFDPIKVALPRKRTVETVSTGTWKGYFERLNEFRIECLASVGARRVSFR